MNKFLILILGLSLIAASCNFLSDTFGLTSGQRGVFKSEDAAESFHSANKLAKGDTSGVSTNGLVFDNQNLDIIYLATSSGIYKSQNAAKQWQLILTGIGVADMVIDTFGSGIIYAAGSSGGHGKIIKSSDQGVSWIDIYTEASTSNPVTSLALAFDSKTILAGLASGEVIRSNDSGRTWQAVHDFSDRVVKIRVGNSSVYVLTAQNGLSKSTDLGNTWTDLTKVLTADSFTHTNNAIASVSAFYDLALDPRRSGVIYLGTKQGLLLSVNDGVNWLLLDLPVKNTQFKVSAITVNPINSNNIYASIGSTVFKSLNGGLTWETKKLNSDQEIRLILVNPSFSNIIYLGLGNKK